VIAPPPGLEGLEIPAIAPPWRGHAAAPPRFGLRQFSSCSISSVDQEQHSPVLQTRTHQLSPLQPQRGTPPLQEPQYLNLPGWSQSPVPRCESPLEAAAGSLADAACNEAWSPELRPLCPQPRRPFVPLFEGQSFSAPAGLELSELLGLGSERQEKQQHLCGEAGYSLESSRPLSSISTSAGGPTPGLDDAGAWQHSSFLEGGYDRSSPCSVAEDDLPMMVRPSSRYGCGAAGNSNAAPCGAGTNTGLGSTLLSTGASTNGIGCGAVGSGCVSVGGSTDLMAAAPDPAAMCCHNSGNILGGWLSEGLGFGGASISSGSGLTFDGSNLRHPAAAFHSLGPIPAAHASPAVPLGGGDGRLEGPLIGTSRGAKGGSMVSAHPGAQGRGNSVGVGRGGKKRQAWRPRDSGKQSWRHQRSTGCAAPY